jgi:hypothetical protein
MYKSFKAINSPNIYILRLFNNSNIIIVSLPTRINNYNLIPIVITFIVSISPYIRFGLIVNIDGSILHKVRLDDMVINLIYRV